MDHTKRPLRPLKHCVPPQRILNVFTSSTAAGLSGRSVMLAGCIVSTRVPPIEFSLALLFYDPMVQSTQIPPLFGVWPWGRRFSALDRLRQRLTLKNCPRMGQGQMAFLKVTRRLDPVRSGPRFADLLHRMGLDVGHAST